jgi:hypothetical protein
MQQDNKKLCSEERKTISLLSENGVRLPDDYSTENVQFPDWPAIVTNDPRMRYFANEAKRTGLGAQCLIFSAIYQEETMPTSMVVHQNDVSLHLKLAQLVNTCTRHQRSLLAEVLRFCEDSTTRKIDLTSRRNLHNDVPSSELIPPIPVTDEALRREFQSNKYSLLNNLPRPRVFYDKTSDITFANFEDCVQDFLAHGFPFSSVAKSGLNQELATLLRDNKDAEVLVRYAMN